MGRKLYALFILIGAFGACILAYLYFFVYYTATITVNANVGEYRVELFSKSTAQKRIEECLESECTISDVSPFNYNVGIFKDGYEKQTLSIDVAPRRSETLFIELEKKVTLTQVVLSEVEESSQERIQRLRAENRSYARFQIGPENFLSFREENARLEMFFEKNGNTKTIADFTKVPENQITADKISSSDSIFLTLGEDSYIFDTAKGKLTELDFRIEIFYIKAGSKSGEYIVITEKGAFLYESVSGKSEFQYLFQDYIYSKNELIGVIFEDEEQKRKNFNLQEETGNLIIQYNPQDKTRKVLYTTDQKIERIEKQENKIILTVGGEKFELKNY